MAIALGRPLSKNYAMIIFIDWGAGFQELNLMQCLCKPTLLKFIFALGVCLFHVNLRW